MTKPEYVKFCNQIRLLELQASKGGEGPLSRDPGLTGFQEQLGEDNTTAGLLPAG